MQRSIASNATCAWFIVAIVLIAGGLLFALRTQQSSSWPARTGVSTAVRSERDPSVKRRHSVTHYATIRFEDGQSVEIHDSGWSTAPKTVGERVQVHINPADPSDAGMPQMRNAVIGWTMALLGFLALPGYFVARRRGIIS